MLTRLMRSDLSKYLNGRTSSNDVTDGNLIHLSEKLSVLFFSSSLLCRILPQKITAEYVFVENCIGVQRLFVEAISRP